MGHLIILLFADLANPLHNLHAYITRKVAKVALIVLIIVRLPIRSIGVLPYSWAKTKKENNDDHNGSMLRPHRYLRCDCHHKSSSLSLPKSPANPEQVSLVPFPADTFERPLSSSDDNHHTFLWSLFFVVSQQRGIHIHSLCHFPLAYMDLPYRLVRRCAIMSESFVFQ